LDIDLEACQWAVAYFFFVKIFFCQDVTKHNHIFQTGMALKEKCFND